MNIHLDGMPVRIVSPSACSRCYSKSGEINLGLVFFILGFFPLCESCMVVLQAELVVQEAQS